MNLLKQKSICFILDHALMKYRIPFFNDLANSGFKITICHIGEKQSLNIEINQIILENKRLFNLEYRRLPDLNKFDIVVHMQNLRVLNLWSTTLNPFRKYELIHWGIGVSSAKGLILKKNFISTMRNLLIQFASAQILYSDFALKLFSKKVLQKTFIAHNTISSIGSVDFSQCEKDSILFIGTLNKRKRVDILIEAFAAYLHKAPHKHINKLLIIGEGECKSEIIDMINQKKLNHHILLFGKITEDREKKQFFKRAAISVSPKQAGLSILECFSYGVPFATFTDAISGGEHLNIQNGKNGFLVNSVSELTELFEKIDDSPFLIQSLGREAYKHYHSSRKMSDMTAVFKKAFTFVEADSKI